MSTLTERPNSTIQAIKHLASPFLIGFAIGFVACILSIYLFGVWLAEFFVI